MKFSGAILSILGLGSPLLADEPVTFSFDGTVAGGWLDLRSVTFQGYGYNGPVLAFEGNASADYAVSETLSLGLIGRVTAREGAQERYDGIDLLFGQQPGKFGKFGLDLAAYVSAGPLLLTYGDMESSFSMATLEIESGGSPIPGGGAVLMNLGGGLGTSGIPLSDASPLEPRFYESRTTRADLTLGDFVFTASVSKNERGKAESAGVKWDRDFGDFGIALGYAYEDGPTRNYRSTSAAFRFKGFKLVANSIRQVPDFGSIDYNLEYRGYSASYDFGRIDLGLARAKQTPTFFSVFTGEAKAFWIGWDINESSRLDFETSQSDYQSGQDVDTASLTYSYRF